LVLLVFAAGYRMLRRQEDEDVPIDAEPEKARMEEILARENCPGVAQNHLAGVSILKPGPIRRVSLRVALWLIAELQRGLSRPGFLNRIGTIHFARWLLLPGTDRLVFLSNYDGSWQSYLEDFIARLRSGLTSVWSNTRDFPKTENLFVGGAGDGTRFKRWARRQQLPTRFWFSAYPQLATDRIRTNAAIRHGFAGATDENAAAQWLAPFGYPEPQNVEKEEIPTLAFGGLPDFRFARCLVVRFGVRAKAREWLREVRAEISHGEHVPLGDRALVAAFSAAGLAALGLQPAALATFPAAFQQGMSAPGRSRALGDENTDQWLWGGHYAPETGRDDERAVHAALLLYAKDAARLATHVGEHKRKLKALGHEAFLEISLRDLPEKDPTTGERDIREPFGFRDGVSQPIMRGSKQWSRREYAMHVVEPGELVLGYRDNLGNLSPTPSDNGADLGRNGTFLVIRHLEQHKDAFDRYVAKQAERIAEDKVRSPGFTGAELEHWVAARMVGRWRDGTSLVRFPHPPPPPQNRQTQPSQPAPREAPRQPDNEFRFGREDPDGLRCPLGAHIRRANPRESFEPGSSLQLAITNRHRILRVGRVYESEPQKAAGLLFMCVNADIERQFEFLQQTWILGPNFHGLDDEIDPIVGYRGRGDSMTVPTPRGPVRLKGLEKFVTTLGGGYFFLPSRSALRVLSD
jgi:Dyp-type peroxidase family